VFVGDVLFIALRRELLAWQILKVKSGKEKRRRARIEADFNFFLLFSLDSEIVCEILLS
jgi:hypothetical protein